MKKVITKIEQQSKDKNRYSIYVDGHFFVGVSEDVLVKYTLRKGMSVDSDLLKSIVHEEEQAKANNYALRLLSFRNRSEKEIIQKMKQKEYNNETIEKTLSYLKTLSLVDDETYASNFFKSKMQTKKYGKVRLKQELYYKGIDKKIINHTVEELSDSNTEYEIALEISKKKLETTYKNDDKKSQYRKLGSFLQRRGFEYDIISKVLNKLL